MKYVADGNISDKGVEKIRQFMVSPGRYLVVPEEGSIEGRVIYYCELIRTVAEE